MDLQLQNKVFLITGGAKGIGKGIATVLANEGAIPVIIDRDLSAIENTVHDLTSDSVKPLGIQAELTSPEDCREAVEKAVLQFGKIDGLINNAGVNDGIGLASGDPERFLASLQKNLNHYYSMAHYVLPYLKTTKGAIVNISSKVAETGQGNTSGYAAANGGRNALTREWAVELLPFGIRVNAVIAAEVWTPLYKSWINGFADPEDKLKTITRRIPLEQRMTTTEEIANAVVFLLSSRASHITGQLLHVDGGYVHLDRACTDVLIY